MCDERMTKLYNIKTNKQIQIELKVKNVSKIRSRIIHVRTYLKIIG